MCVVRASGATMGATVALIALPRVLLSRASDLRRSCLPCVCAACIDGFALYEKNVHQPWPHAALVSSH